MSPKTEKLKLPSIAEAVCELRFAQGVSYTMVPGAMRERLRPRFPEFEVLPTATLMGGIPEEVITPPVPHHRFKCKGPNALVQTGPRLLTVNILPTYPSFEVFRDLILFALRHYSEVAEPGNPVRVALRYINHIRSKELVSALHEYLKISVSYPEQLPTPPQELAARLLLNYGDVGLLGLAVAFPARVGQGETGALLDLDFFWTGSREFDLKGFPKWLDRAHECIYQAFECVVTDSIMKWMRGG